jgi:hypothetical protein
MGLLSAMGLGFAFTFFVTAPRFRRMRVITVV